MLFLSLRKRLFHVRICYSVDELLILFCILTQNYNGLNDTVHKVSTFGCQLRVQVDRVGGGHCYIIPCEDGLRKNVHLRVVLLPNAIHWDVIYNTYSFDMIWKENLSLSPIVSDYDSLHFVDVLLSSGHLCGICEMQPININCSKIRWYLYFSKNILTLVTMLWQRQRLVHCLALLWKEGYL